MAPHMQEQDAPTFNYKRVHGSISEQLSEYKTKQDERRRLYILLTCAVTVFFNLVLASAAFVCAAIIDSSAGYAFALDCSLDVVAATLLIWRFYGSSSTYSQSKEAKACFWLGGLLCLASVGIIAKSVCDLVSHTVPQQLTYLFILAGIGGVMNSSLGGLKYCLGKQMNSESLILEAVNTMLSGVLAAMLAFSDILFYYHPSAWAIDPVTSIFVAFILFLGGVRVLFRKKHSEETTPLIA